MKIKDERVRSILYIVIALGLSHVLPMVFYYLVDMSVFEHIMDTVPGGSEDRLQAYTDWYLSYDWLLFIIEFIIKIAITAFLLKYLLKFSLKDIKSWFPYRTASQFVIGVLLGIVSITIVFLVLALTDNAHVVSWQPNFSLGILKYLLVFVFVGFSEELFYRGFMITNLKSFKNVPLIMMLSSVIFSLDHSWNKAFNLMSFLNIILIGVVLAYIFIKSKSLWMPVGFHILWNYCQGSIYGFNVSGVTVPSILMTEYESDNIFNGGGFGPEAGVVTTIVTFLGLLFIWWYFRAKNTAPDLK